MRARRFVFLTLFWLGLNPILSWADDALKDVETITVLPIILSENIKLKDPEKFQKNVHKMLLRKLAMKGYVLDRPRKWQLPENWSAAAILAMSQQQLLDILPEHAEHSALLIVEDLAQSNKVVATGASTRVSAMIVERETESIIWTKQDEGKHKENWFGTGYLVMLITPDRYFALEKAFAKLFKDFPEKEYQ